MTHYFCLHRKDASVIPSCPMIITVVLSNCMHYFLFLSFYRMQNDVKTLDKALRRK